MPVEEMNDRRSAAVASNRDLQLMPGEHSKAAMMWGKARHRVSLWLEERSNSTFTGFLRLPTQYEALVGPVFEFLQPGQRPAPSMITVFGCSNGAEPYSIASVLTHRHPKLDFLVRAYDIDPDCVRRASEARYKPEEVFNNKIITEEFVSTTFDRENEVYVIKPEIRRRVEFDAGDILSREVVATVGPSDVVFAQNFLFHMSPSAARRALDHLRLMLAPRAALFIDGVDLGLRQRSTRRHGLVPLDYKIERIHDEARRARGVGWPRHYWGLEPFLSYRGDRQRRYATIFLTS